jgi:uncharacterized lipoprotein YbaY
MRLNPLLAFLAVGLAGLIQSGCKTREVEVQRGPVRTYSGTLNLAQPVELPASSSARISLIQNRSGGEPPVVLATTQIMTRGRQFPLTFRIGVEERLLQPGRTYALSAAVAVSGQLRYIALPPLEVSPTGPFEGLEVMLTVPEAAR